MGVSVREYVEGISLHELVAAQGPLSPAQVRAIALSLCQILQYLHSQCPPVICRDVKPQNVVLDAAGRCHLIDLGAARLHWPEKQGDTVFLGTQITAPPEQFGYQQTDQRSDIYSLGMLLRFLCTGSFDPPSSHHLEPGFLRRVIRRCTAFDPQHRYSSVQAVSRSLKYRWQRRGIAAAIGVACIAILFGLLWSNPGSVQPQSSLLEDALRQELHLEEGEPIPRERLMEVEQLLVCGQTLAGSVQEHAELAEYCHDHYTVENAHGDISDHDLELLSQCTNLRVLVLDYQQITDLSPLANLSLEYLSLTGNQIANLAPLSGMEALRVLDLGENPVRSVYALAELPALQEVTLEATGITSVDVFAESGIQSLNVRKHLDYGFLVPGVLSQPLPPDCGGAARRRCGNIAGLINLEELRLYATSAVDLSYFVGFQKLRELDLYGSAISHPEALAQLPSLRVVNLGGTGVCDLSFLTQLSRYDGSGLAGRPSYRPHPPAGTVPGLQF